MSRIPGRNGGSDATVESSLLYPIGKSIPQTNRLLRGIIGPMSESIRCKCCEYILDGLPENRCPECGRLFDPSDARTYLSHRNYTRPYWPYLVASFGWIVARGSIYLGAEYRVPFSLLTTIWCVGFVLVLVRVLFFARKWFSASLAIFVAPFVVFVVGVNRGLLFELSIVWNIAVLLACLLVLPSAPKRARPILVVSIIVCLIPFAFIAWFAFWLYKSAPVRLLPWF